MSMFPIASNTVATAGTYAATFSSIPQTFQHLEIRIFGRGTVSATSVDNLVQINGDVTNANYTTHSFSGNGTAASSNALVAGTYWTFPQLAGGNATAGVFGVTIAQILDYTSTTKNKVFRAIGGSDNNGSGIAELRSGVYFNATILPVTSISFYMANAAVGTTVQLYGIQSSPATGA